MMIRCFSALAVALAMAACSPQVAEADRPAAPVTASVHPVSGLEVISLTVTTARGPRTFRTEVARTPQEQARGLMFRESLPADGGMLFPFETVRPAAFWMRNTIIPLDMIFIRADGSIARIAKETVPQSLETVESGEPVIAVLEIAGGRASELGIEEGDKAMWQDGPG